MVKKVSGKVVRSNVSDNKQGNESQSDSVPYTIVAKPLFAEELPPHHFHKGFLYFLTGSGQWEQANNVASVTAQSEKDVVSPLNVLTYNIWGAPQDKNSPLFNFEKRKEAILDILTTENPDVICLQEVSKEWAEAILSNQFIRDHYFSTDPDSGRMVSYFGLSQMTLSKFPITSSTVYGLPGYEIYSLLSTQIQYNGKNVCINNVHLHSGAEYSAFRIAQLKTIQNIISKNDADLNILAGDFNFGDGPQWSENQHIPNDFQDIWKKTHKRDPGFTEDTNINKMRFNFKKKIKQERFDRILLKDKKSLCKAFDIKKLGTKPIDGAGETWPSDHFGLASKIEI